MVILNTQGIVFGESGYNIEKLKYTIKAKLTYFISDKNTT
jgi:hypothetical protein